MDLGDRAAEVAVLEAAGDERHLPQVLAEQLRLPVGRVSCARLETGTSLPSRVRSSVCASLDGIEPDRVRQTHAHRDASIQQPQVGAASPSHAAESCCATCSTVRPARPAADRIDGPGDFRVAALHADDVHDAVDLAEHLLDRFGGLSSTSGSSPKILTSIGVGLPSRSPSMSCSSWTNSIPSSGAASCQLRPQLGDDLLELIGSAAPRGFSRTRMSPVFCAVANRPSSDPVRREYDATSGVSLQNLLDRPHLAVGLLERGAGRRQVVDDEAALVCRRQEAGADGHEQPDGGRRQHQRRRQPQRWDAASSPRATASSMRSSLRGSATVSCTR